MFVTALKGGVLSWGDQQYLHEPAIDGTTCLLERLRWIVSTPFLDEYNPLHRIGIWVQLSLWGRAPQGYHLVSMVLHAANALLIYGIARSLSLHRVPAAVAATLFAMHPTRVEVVAWIAAQRELGATLFVLLGLLAYSPVLTGKARLGAARYCLVAACFLLALLYDSTTFPFPLLLLVLDLAWRRPARRALMEKLPMLALAGVFAFLTVGLAPPGHRADGSWTTPAVTALQATWLYAERIFCPVRYSPRWWVGPHADLPALYPVLGLAVLTAGAYGGWRLGRTGRLRSALLALAWPIVCLVPVAILSPTSLAVADRYLYLALLGPLLALAEGWTRWIAAGRLASSLPVQRRLVWVAGSSAALLFLAITSQRQVAVFGSDESLWRAALGRQPSNPAARVELAKSLLWPRTDDEATPEARIARARRALAIVNDASKDPEAQRYVIPQRCELLTVLGRHEEAARVLEEGLEWVRRWGPRLEIALCHARHLGAVGRYREAHDVLAAYAPQSREQREQILSGHVELCLDVDDFAGFLEWSEKLLELRPFDTRLWYNREIAARILGDEEELNRSKRRLDQLLPPSPLRALTVTRRPAVGDAAATR